MTSKERKARKVTGGMLLRIHGGERWSLDLECGHLAFRPAFGNNPKLPSRVNRCEKCEVGVPR